MVAYVDDKNLNDTSVNVYFSMNASILRTWNKHTNELVSDRNHPLRWDGVLEHIYQ